MEVYTIYYLVGCLLSYPVVGTALKYATSERSAQVFYFFFAAQFCVETAICAIVSFSTLPTIWGIAALEREFMQNTESQTSIKLYRLAIICGLPIVLGVIDVFINSEMVPITENEGKYCT